MVVASSIETAGKALLVEVDPTGPTLALPSDGMAEPARSANSEWDVDAQRLERFEFLEALHARFIDGRAWAELRWYEHAVDRVAEGARPLDVGSEENLSRKLARLEELFGQFQRGSEATVAQGVVGASAEIEVGFDRAGRVVLLRGHGEFAVARLAGVRSMLVPVRVRHAEWEEAKERIRDYARRRKGRVYQRIDHPDLVDFPFHHGDERAEMLRAALADYPATGARLMDIGTHWGHMSQQMEKLGFACTAIEVNATCANFARLLARASQCDFDIWHGSVFDFPGVEEQEVVLALNIFHHLIKTEELHERLISFLRRLRSTEIVLFEPHVADPPGQMAGAHRNYAEEEFAEFVARHSGLTSVEPLGRAGDGRPLFKLVR